MAAPDHSTRYEPHWQRVFAELLKLPDEIFDDQWRDCPLCAASGTFKSKLTQFGFHSICNSCGGSGDGGILAPMQIAARILDTDLGGARKRIDQFLGVTPTVDPDEIACFLDALGKSPSDAKTRAFFPKDHPRKAEDRGRKGGLNLATLQRWQDEGRGLYLVIGNGGHKDAEITDVPALFVEWDDRPRDWQVTAWQELGLPEPSLQVDTGGRSIHSYWILDQPMPPDAWRKLQEGLLIHCGADQTIKNPSRVMRLPGSWYLDGIGAVVAQCRIIGGSGERFDAEMLHRVIHSESQLDGSCSPVMQSASLDAVPLVELLPREQAALVRAGVGEGGRNDACFRLAAVALAVTEGAADAGVRVQGTAEALVLDFAARCAPPLSEREALTCLRSAASQPRTPDPGLQKRIDYHTRPKRDRPAREAAAPPSEPPASEPLGDRWPFAMLGFNGSDMFYQPSESGQVMSISRNNHNSSTLIGLARLEFWETRYGRFNRDGECTGVRWTQAASDLVGRQYEIGVYDPKRIRGVGAWWDNGRVFYHLGDRICVDGRTWPVLEPPPSTYLYQRLPRREGQHGAEPLTDIQGNELLSLAERFHWEAKASGILMAGWVALAPICGVLQWRPHIWLNAVAGSGKSSLMKYFVQYLLGDLPLRVIGNTTEAGIRQTLKSDALPIMFDEAESNSNADAARIQSVLSLARISSTDDQGVTLKGSPSAEATMFNVRSMFFLSSINTALKQGADRSRFSVLVLRVPDNLTEEEKQEHWNALKDDLVRAITPETGKRMIARMVSLAGMVRETATVMAQAAALELGSARQGDQIGALLAGAYALQHQDVPSLEQARAWVRNSGVREQSEGQADERGGDQGDCLRTILQARLRVETGKGVATRTVAELIDISQQSAKGARPLSEEVDGAMAQAELARNGILVHSAKGTGAPNGITVSNSAEGIKRILKDTPWCSGGWSTLLKSLPGARKTDSPVWFPQLKAMSRGTVLPQSLLESGI